MQPVHASGGLSDQEFWRLVGTLSEPAGAFELSDTFVSNETSVPELARWLRPSGGVYIGVGPEQNFTYIAALRPAMAFIVDIRREMTVYARRRSSTGKP